MKLELNAKIIQIVILIVLLALFVGSGITGYFIYGDYNVKQVENLTNQLKSLQIDYDSVKLNYNNCTANLINANTANDNLIALNQNLTLQNSACQSNLSSAEIKISELQITINKSQDDYNALASNSASRICCIIKNNYNPNIKYYSIENNTIVCSDTSGIEFSC